MEENKP